MKCCLATQSIHSNLRLYVIHLLVYKYMFCLLIACSVQDPKSYDTRENYNRKK
uniref:Uncharacterized protein n=1 Tax=Rhizophora mucronata TaxID=61149 RepID=A0A2P2N5Y8_RHIMU